jgi:hypothetical protein
VTVSPVQDLIGLSHEMRLDAVLWPMQGRVLSNSPVSWGGVPVGDQRVANGRPD